MEEERKKTGKGKTITIIILIILLLAATGYIIYSDIYIPYYAKVDTKDLDVDDDEEEDTRQMYVSEEKGMERKINDYLYLAGEFEKNNVKDFDNQELLNFVLRIFGKYDKSFTKGEVEQIIDDYFGSNVEIKHEDIICPVENIPLYKYEDEKYVIDDEHPMHNGQDYYGGEVHVISGEVNEKEKEYILKTRILYTIKSMVGYADGVYYKSIDDIKNNKNIINNNIKPQEYKDVESFLPITTFKFNKKEKKYYLKSVSIEE